MPGRTAGMNGYAAVRRSASIMGMLNARLRRETRMPNDGVGGGISNSDILNGELKARNLQKFIEIRKELIKDLGNPEWYSKNKVPKTVKYIVDKACPYAQENGRVIEHYYVWWKNHPKDPVKYNEEIFHINGDRTDNRIENLKKISKKLHKKPKGGA